MCLICMKYRIIIVNIIIISLGEILLSYIAHHTRASMHAHACMCMHARTHTHTHRRLRSGLMHRWRPSVTKLTPSFMAGSWDIQMNTHAGDLIYPRFWMFFAFIQKLLGRTESRTRDRMYCQTIRTVRDTSPETIEQELRPAVCERRQTDLIKENYSI